MREYLATPVYPDPLAVLQHQLEHRQETFLEMLRSAVFQDPKRPYFQMFEIAGCSYADLESSVRDRGLEPTLQQLLEAGVYLTHDEFKGKVPVVRSERFIATTPDSFRNPLVRGGMSGLTSGSRSRGTRVLQDTRSRLYREAWQVLRYQEWQVEGHLPITLNPILPSTTGLSFCLMQSRFGQPVRRWFTAGDSVRRAGHYRLLTCALVAAARRMGADLPFPTILPRNDFSPLARYIAEEKRRGARCHVNAFTSPAVRVASAALQLGLDISGTVFTVGGEALTDAKRAVIESAGAEVYSFYPISEVGGVGVACRQMKSDNCVHLCHDRVAVIQRRTRTPAGGQEVDALYFTSLQTFAPFVLINAEMGDAGVIEPATCDCLFSRFGFRWQIRGVYSYGKMTGQGITLVGTDLLRILEQVLPARLGGAPGDYQLVEVEGADQTYIVLRVSPRIRGLTPERVRESFLKEVRACYGGSLADRTWRHAAGLKVVIAEPFATRTGKVLPLHLLGRRERTLHAP
ncbi:MAG: hypothetical protein ACUVXB_12550 [Bryobacteraceae bacterium]